MTLLILAAGMGKRFGGVKQLESIGRHGELIIDYSIYDAIEAGFDKVVFVIRREIEKDFRTAIFNRMQKFIKCKYVFQKEPLGTGHAILAARNAIKEPFCVINADDFYGRGGYTKIAEFLKSIRPKNLHAMVIYKLCNTISDAGVVSRGVCKIQNGEVVNIEEKHGINKHDANMSAVASMNFFGFTPDIFQLLQQKFENFLELNKDNLKPEFGITTVLNELLQSGEIKMKALATDDEWMGLTYPKDKDTVILKIEELLQSDTYPVPLWS